MAGDPAGLFGPNLLEGLAGIALPGFGGLIAGAGMNILGGAMGSFNDASNAVKNNVEEMQRAQLFNAAGRTGGQVKPSFDLALNSLQNSAEARNAANNTNEMGSRLLSQGQGMMDDISRNSQRALGRQSTQIGQMARDRGIGGGGLANIANQMQDTSAQTLGQQGERAAQNALQSTAQAGELFSKAPQILNQDLANRNDIYVKPFYAQSSGIGNNAINTIPQVFQTMYDDKAAFQPMAGFSASLGSMGQQFGNNMMNDMSMQRNYNIFQNMFNTPRSPIKDKSVGLSDIWGALTMSG